MRGIFGLVFNLTTTPELPGEGPADDDTLSELVTRLRNPSDIPQART
jgi:hypothetical protein